jgi:hypothetical protein
MKLTSLGGGSNTSFFLSRYRQQSFKTPSVMHLLPDTRHFLKGFG